MGMYIEYTLVNKEPVRIADDSKSQSGQAVTLTYIPGSAVRGMVITALAEDADFQSYKKELFSADVRFMNAYPEISAESGAKILFPSPKGFYEDKSENNKLRNVVKPDPLVAGDKRASLGQYCWLDGKTIRYHSVRTGSDMKIRRNVEKEADRTVIRNEYIVPGNRFVGHIYVKDEALAGKISQVLQGTALIGNARSNGYGKCAVSCREADAAPYSEYEAGQDQQNECYMILLSNTVMRDENGQLCGLDLTKLGALLGVENLKIRLCSTSVVDVKGYNRVWNSKIPSAVMYAMGSVFHFTFDGTLTKESMRKLENEGIGIRRNEGFGRVLFPEKSVYENLASKDKCGEGTASAEKASAASHSEDPEVLRGLAKIYYKNQIEKAVQKYVMKQEQILPDDITSSQLGVLESLVTANRYNAAEGAGMIADYFDHAEQKQDTQKMDMGRNIKQLKKYVTGLLETPIGDLLEIDLKDPGSVMGFDTGSLLDKEEIARVRLELLREQIRFKNKKGDR